MHLYSIGNFFCKMVIFYAFFKEAFLSCLFYCILYVNTYGEISVKILTRFTKKQRCGGI